jgi:hypothetical protein
MLNLSPKMTCLVELDLVDLWWSTCRLVELSHIRRLPLLIKRTYRRPLLRPYHERRFCRHEPSLPVYHPNHALGRRSHLGRGHRVKRHQRGARAAPDPLGDDDLAVREEDKVELGQGVDAAGVKDDAVSDLNDENVYSVS